MEEELQREEANVHVLTYYGIGGIGKSSLLKKIMEEMEERLDEPAYVYFDFNLQQECRAVLEALKNKLADSCKFEFPLFELGGYIYAKKIGENPDAPEAKPLLKKSPAVELLLNIAGEIPVVGSATKILDLAEKGVAAFRGYLQEHRKELRQIERMEAEELYDYLPSLFAEDLTCAMEKLDTPLVIMLDTYERMVNEMSAAGEPLSKDVWLRGEDGLVQNIPGVLWVIAGREKLKWERFDSEWSEALEQHLLGSLSSQDSDQFLSSAGVADSELRLGLYDLTGGTPVYLNLCVDQYRRLEERGVEPKVEMFGRDTFDLIERFARYMDDAQKDIVYVLSCLGHWNDGEIAAIAQQVVPGFSITTYEKVKGLSFITQSGDGDYNIHQTVGEVLLESCPALLRERTARCGLDYFGAVLKEAGLMEPRYAEALGYCVRFALLLGRGDDNALWDLCARYVVEPLRRISVGGGFAQAESVLEPLIRHADEVPGTRFYGNVYSEYSGILRAKGDYPGALSAAEAAWNCLCECLGQEHRETLRTGYVYACALYMKEKKKEALEISTLVYEKSREVLGEDHPDTLTAMRSLAMDLSYNGQDEEALGLNGRALEKMERIYGLQHRETLLTMANRANFLKYVGRTEEALELADRVLALRIELLGENHPDVLASMSNKASVLEKMGRGAETPEMRLRILEKRREVQGERHPSTLAAMEIYGDALYDAKRYEEALPLYQEVYEGRCEVLGEKSRKTLISANSVAYCLKCLKRYDEALEWFRRTVEGRRETLGEKNTSTLWSTEAWGDVLYSLKRYEEALPVYRAAYEGRREVLGENHVNTAASVNYLAYCCKALGRKEETETYFRATAASFRAIYGEKNPTALWALSDWADALYALGRYAEALPLYHEVYAGRWEVLGEKDRKTLSSANDLAFCYKALRQYEDSLPWFAVTVAGRREVLGEKNSTTLWSINGNGDALYHLERYEEALPLYREAFEGRLELGGWDNAQTITSATNLAITLKCMGEYAQALPLYRELYDVCGRFYGRTHSRTTEVLDDLAYVLARSGQSEEALTNYRCLAEIYGEDPHQRKRQLYATKNVTITLWILGRTDEARELCHRLVEDYAALYGVDHPETTSTADLCRRLSGE